MHRLIPIEDYQADSAQRLRVPDLKVGLVVTVRVPTLFGGCPLASELIGLIHELATYKGGTWILLHLKEREERLCLNDDGFILLRPEIGLSPGYLIFNEDWKKDLDPLNRQATACRRRGFHLRHRS
jgi:hypothetical protein